MVRWFTRCAVRDVSRSRDIFGQSVERPKTQVVEGTEPTSNCLWSLRPLGSLLHNFHREYTTAAFEHSVLELFLASLVGFAKHP